MRKRWGRVVGERRLLLAALVVALGLSLKLPLGWADVRPGDFITADNADRVKDLVSPGVYWHVINGMTMKIVPSERIDWPPPYKDATEKYSAQVRLSDDHRSLVGYVAGQPFPLLDPHDPFIANKIIWNNVFRPLATDDYDLRYYDCDATRIGKNRRFFSLTHTQAGHYAGYNLVGRTEVEPLPIDPDFKQTGRLWLFALYPVLAPAQWRGAGLIRWRYADPNRGDDAWGWQPGTRRLRRLNEAMLSSATGSGTGVETSDPDHYLGFNAKPEEYDFRFLGERDMLASVHAEHSPEVRCETDGGGTACPEAWEMRHMYVVEATPRPGKTNVVAGKTIIYMDSEMWFAPYTDTYDRDGQLFQSHIYWLAYRDRPVPDARVAIYPFKRSFVVGAATADVQSGLANMCYLPGRESPERECWYINMGAVDKSFFTPAAMARSALLSH